MESSVWGKVEGNVIEVLDGNTIAILTDKGHTRKKVYLAGIGAPAMVERKWKAAREMLARLVLNKHVAITISPSLKMGTDEAAADELSGVVSLADLSVNRKMIELDLQRRT